jgi:hypothetical protein
MSAQHGYPSLDLSDNAHLADMQSVADLIRIGSSSSSPPRTDVIGINSDISVQVNKEKETIKPSAQRVLGEAFCINRLKEIRQLAGNAKLRDFTDGSDRDHREKEITHLFRRFLRENVEGDPPFFCVSAAILGRLIHTFKEEYISRDKVRRTAIELDLHVDEIVVGQAKESMSQDAIAIRMQTQNFIDKQKRLVADTHTRCEAAMSGAHARM